MKILILSSISAEYADKRWLLPPQGFGPRGPKPEEAHIEVPARNMILFIDVYTRQNLSLSVFARKASLNTRCKYRERFFHVTGKFTV